MCAVGYSGRVGRLLGYYVTRAKVFPDKIDMLGLPYKKAYESALAMMERLGHVSEGWRGVGNN